MGYEIPIRYLGLLHATALLLSAVAFAWVARRWPRWLWPAIGLLALGAALAAVRPFYVDFASLADDTGQVPLPWDLVSLFALSAAACTVGAGVGVALARRSQWSGLVTAACGVAGYLATFFGLSPWWPTLALLARSE